MDPDRELLVVAVPGADPGAAVAAVAGRVTQRLGDRVALAVVPDPRRAELEALSEVTGVFSGDVPEAVLDELDDGERLFVEAWMLRAKPKDRPGGGLSWDAPGFRPPG